MRFADLFLTRERWKAEHIKPYLSDLTVDNTKDHDKLLLKYARALTDKDAHGILREPNELEKQHCIVVTK
jgi:hypothetical protein